jgi:hypothetical protein
MLTTLIADLHPDGGLHFHEPVKLVGVQRVLVTFTHHVDEAASGALLSEAALARDWLNDDEDEAWAHLRSDADASSASGGSPSAAR